MLRCDDGYDKANVERGTEMVGSACEVERATVSEKNVKEV